MNITIKPKQGDTCVMKSAELADAFEAFLIKKGYAKGDAMQEAHHLTVFLGSYEKQPEEKNGWYLLKQYGRDMHRSEFVELICPHGGGHHKGVHGCHPGIENPSVACCYTAPPELWAQVSEDK